MKNLVILALLLHSCVSYQIVKDPPKQYKPVVIVHGILEDAAGLQDLQDKIHKGPPMQYKPVVIIHGILDNAATLQDLKDMVLKAHPGTNVTAIDLYPDDLSLRPLWPQVHDFAEAMKPIMRDAGEGGINIICYSQGGVICRGVLATIPDHNVKNFIALSSPLMSQFGDTSTFKFIPVKFREEVYRGVLATLPDHNVKNFIALSSPLMGQFGDTSTFNKFIPPMFREEVYRFCYGEIGMDTFSICQYWNDPYEQDLYKKASIFLAVLNNQTYSANSTAWKNNFLRIENLVMIGGPDDGVITPWQSSHFGFYDANLTVVEMEQQEVYKEDYFGLRTLDKRNSLHKCIMSGVIHTHWHSNQTVFDNCIEPWLK